MIEEKYLVKFSKNPGIESEMLNKMELPDLIPTEYIKLLQKFNGGEGFIGEEYLKLFEAEQLKEINQGYEIEEFDKYIYLIGSNGSGEALAIDLRESKYKYILILFLFEHSAIIELGTNLNELFKRIYETGYFE